MKQYYRILISDWGWENLFVTPKFRCVSDAEKYHNRFFNAEEPSALRRKYDGPIGEGGCPCEIVLCCEGCKGAR